MPHPPTTPSISLLCVFLSSTINHLDQSASVLLFSLQHPSVHLRLSKNTASVITQLHSVSPRPGDVLLISDLRPDPLKAPPPSSSDRTSPLHLTHDAWSASPRPFILRVPIPAPSSPLPSHPPAPPSPSLTQVADSSPHLNSLISGSDIRELLAAFRRAHPDTSPFDPASAATKPRSISEATSR